MPEWLVVARREFWERVRTIWFIIVTILGPAGLIAIIVVPAWLEVESAKKESKVTIVDHSGKVGAQMGAAFALINIKADVVDADTPESELLSRIADNDIDGFLMLPDDVMTGGTAVYRGANATNFKIAFTMQQTVTSIVQAVRATEAGIPPEQLMAVLMPVRVETVHTTGSAEGTSGTSAVIVGYIAMMILYMAILLYAVNVMRSVVLEKTSRVVEVLVSSVKPRSLMLGKILGVGAVGLFQLTLWALIALLLLNSRGTVLGWFGVTGTGFPMPDVSALDLGVVLAYFLAGYFFYSALYAAIGAMVNSDQEAQQVQTPVVLLLIIPILCAQLVSGDPRSGAAEILTLIPFSAPVLMPMRYLLDGASLADVAVSLGILIASTALIVLIAARIYRIGILMYGKRPSLRELARWIRYK
jgi:ABC-2 type transport system permease protein